jgi:hypothetical protein
LALGKNSNRNKKLGFEGTLVRIIKEESKRK